MKETINKNIKELNEVLKGSNDIKSYDKIKESLEKLKNSALEIGKILYQNNQQAQQSKGKPEDNDPKNKSKK